MNEKVDSFCRELRAKLDGVDKRIKDLKAGAKSATEKGKVEAVVARMDADAAQA
jgi:hypothetical protein